MNNIMFNIMKPYFNLQHSEGPIHCKRPLIFNKLINTDKPEIYGLGMWMFSGFRENLISESGLSEYPQNDPRHLAKHKRTNEWDVLIYNIDNFNDLSINIQFSTIQLLVGLCFYKEVNNLTRNIQIISNDNLASGILYYKLLCEELLNGYNKKSSYGEIINNTSKTQPFNFKTRLWLVKKIISTENLNKASSILDDINKDFNSINVTEPKDKESLKLALLRTQMYLSEKKNNFSEVESYFQNGMEISNYLYQDSDPTTSFIGLEAQQRFLDRIIQFGLTTNNHNSVLDYAIQQIQLDPYNAKAYYQLGNIYYHKKDYNQSSKYFSTAADFGPFASMGTPISWFYAGISYEKIGNLEMALNSYLEAIKFDPFGKSILDRIIVLAEKLNINPIINWAKERILSLRSVDFSYA